MFTEFSAAVYSDASRREGAHPAIRSRRRRIKLTAESLDLTPWYDLLVSKKQSTNQIESAKQQPVSTASKTEPAAIPLSFSPFTFDAAIGSLLSGLLSGVFKAVAIVLQLPDLTRSPVDFVDARADVSAGTVNLRSLFVQSPMFQATSAGTISLADPAAPKLQSPSLPQAPTTPIPTNPVPKKPGLFDPLK